MASDLKAEVTEILVQAENKSWDSDSRMKGSSSNTVVSWSLKPPAGSVWTPDQAMVVTILIRKELQRILLADSMARGTTPPDGGVESLEGYNDVVKTFTSGRS
jgi:hypothetical protein